jgi:hypothetical protein
VALHTSATNTSAKAVAEISQKATGGQTADVADLATDRSLWDKAYDTLKDEKSNRIDEYERLLSRVLIRGKPLLRLRRLSSTLTQGNIA